MGQVNKLLDGHYYKLLTRLLVRKINPVLPSVLSPGQLCVPGRDIMSGAMGLISTIIHARMHKIQAAIVSIDLRKAYDRVSIPFLVQVMSKMEFPEKVINWILMIHRGNQARFLLDTPSKLINILFLTLGLNNSSPVNCWCLRIR